MAGSAAGRRVDHRDRAGAVPAEGQQQCEAVAGIDLQGSRLRIAQPAFGDEVVEKRMQALLADVRRRLARQGESDLGMLGFEVGGIVGKDAAA